MPVGPVDRIGARDGRGYCRLAVGRLQVKCTVPPEGARRVEVVDELVEGCRRRGRLGGRGRCKGRCC